MRYVEFRDAIQGELRRSPAGLTWAALKSRLRLPYSTPCPEWVKQLEQEIGLRRERGAERAFTWKIAPAKANGAATTAKRPVQRNAGDWRAATLARMRTLILQAVPEMVEERKWRKPSNGMVGIPVWSHGGIVCTGETYAKVVKLTFAQGAKLPD